MGECDAAYAETICLFLKPVTILIATGIYPPDIGGPATYTKFIAEEFSRAGHRVIVVTYGNSTSQPAEFPVRVISRWLPKGIRHIAYSWQVFRQSRHVDIIFAQDPVSAGLPACVAAFLRRTRFVLKVVGDYAWEQGVQRFGVTDLLDDFLQKSYGPRIELLRFIERYVARSAERVIVPSAYLASVARIWGVSPERISVIYNGVSLPKVLLSKSEARFKLGIADDKTILFSFGRDVPWKGFQMLRVIEPLISKSFPKVELKVGEVSREERDLWFGAADVFLLNTGYEGFSHQLLEAMNAGLPIITTVAGGNKEIVRDGENALVAGYNNMPEWESQIKRALADNGLRNRLAANARETSSRYTKETMIAETKEILGV